MKLEVLKKLSLLALVSFPGIILATAAATTTNTEALSPETTATDETITLANATNSTTTTHAKAHASSSMDNLNRKIDELNTKTEYLEQKIQQIERAEKDDVENSRETSGGTSVTPTSYAKPSRMTGVGSLPRFGIGADVFGDDLYIHDFGLNRDLQLLLQKEYIQQTVGSFDDNPRILISGLIQAGAASHTSDAFGIYKDFDGQTLDATSAIDFSAFVSDWWMGYFEFDGDSHGDVTVDQIFVTTGNLDQFPGYATLGFIYVPNGSYRTKMITDTLPQKLARTRENTALLGFDYAEFERTGLNGAVYVMDAEPQETETNRLNQWGANLAMRYVPLTKDAFAFDIGASYMNNIASSSGISGKLPDDMILNGYVPAFNVRGKASKGRFFGYAEYVFSIDAFSQENVVDNRIDDSTGKLVDSDSVMPEASHFELGVNFDLLIPMTLSVAFDQSNDALAFGLPEEQYGSTLEMDVYSNTIVSVEYAQLRDYDEDEVATIEGEAPVQGTGELDKVARIEVNVYF